MIKKQLLLILAVTTFGYVNTAHSQSPISGFMQGKGKGNISVSYSSEKYDKVYLVPQETDGVPVFNEVQLNSTNLYATYGVSDKLDLVLSVPYIQAEGSASQDVLNNLNFSNERSGFQDVSFYLKYNPYYHNFGKSSLRLIGAVGLKTPLSDYRADEGLQSIIAIGNRSTTVSGLGLAMFKMDNGVFASGQFGVNLASNDVPNSITSELKLGYAASKFYGDAYIAGQKTNGGVDILGEGFQGFFPATTVNYTKVGVNLYTPLYKDFGLAAGASTLVAGRNIGKATGYYGAVVYKF
ncbi:MAG: hypothetical protein K2Y30_15740 [Flavobacteriaceae bacterium]|uniref:MetA-pathway of phenol degradation n=1 Tax=Flavobacterium kayseriense TaxID=2764714 RepID=A0ABR7J9B6_9FLAO|nr:hypothetical protein [Flavobacterium kayseriense]MBC5842119.1 hypothetical protein [Flavobacterium kayseriense]MBC5848649.1 hypothetical protein [Flavobacterium kayseriense]MBU0941324.1 hypothetical protein [Bacteroidota bacterium]MBX9889373.1 hypothetical protein [Flavobacteriaceae bacterium]